MTQYDFHYVSDGRTKNEEKKRRVKKRKEMKDREPVGVDLLCIGSGGHGPRFHSARKGTGLWPWSRISIIAHFRWELVIKGLTFSIRLPVLLVFYPRTMSHKPSENQFSKAGR